MGLVLYVVVLMFLVAVLWKISSVFRYYLKFTLFVMASWLGSTAPIPLMCLKPRDSRNALFPAAVLRFSAKLMGLTYRVEGLENIVENSGCVVLINHQSILDLIILAYLWPIMDNCTVISKKEIFYLQPFGLASWLWGTIFIDRADAKGARAKVSKSEKAIRKKKSRILMFPEGTRSLGNKLLPFKKGAFHLALEAECPIQPVVVSRYKFLGNKSFDAGHINIKILPAISTKEYTKDNLTKLIDNTYDVMSKNVDLISGEDSNKIKAN